MQSLSTFSQLTAEELVHLHRHKKYRRIRTRSISVQVSSSDDARIQLVCSNEDWNLKINFNAQTESVAVAWSGWTEVECLPAPLCIFSILHWASQQASANIHETGLFFLHLQSLRHSGVKQRFPAARECTCKEPLPVALASDCTNAASLTYESHKDSYIYTRTATPQREIVFSWYDDQMLGIEHTVMDVKACLIAKMHV